MIPKTYFHFSVLLLAVAFWVSGCSKSDDQREFENNARTQAPQGITEMTFEGTVVAGKQDPDDWRIAPMFGGLIDVETPAYPNPVAFNSNLSIDLYISGLETISALEVYAFKFPGELYGPLYIEENLSSTTLVTINLNASSIAHSTGGSEASNIYRLLIFDGRQNLITYGDVRIE